MTLSDSPNPPDPEPARQATLELWRGNAWLVAKAPTRSGIASLLAVAEREFSDAAVAGLSTDSRFVHAYTAGLSAAHAALVASGYDAAKGSSHHLRIIASLEHTLGTEQDDIDLFDLMRRKRNQGLYERVGVASPTEANEMLALAKRLIHDVRRWLKDKHPDLIGR